jgi:hypothetical protein
VLSFFVTIGQWILIVAVSGAPVWIIGLAVIIIVIRVRRKRIVKEAEAYTRTLVDNKSDGQQS